MASAVRLRTAMPRPFVLPRVARLPTGIKLFLILSLGLLPLALIGIFATLQINRLADSETRARLGITSYESARVIAAELMADINAVSSAVDALGHDRADPTACQRVKEAFAQPTSLGARFAITDRLGRLSCGTRLSAAEAALAGDDTSRAPLAATIVPGNGVELILHTSRAGLTAHAYFPREMLAALARPSSRSTPVTSALTLGETSLPLETVAGAGALDRTATAHTDLGIAALSLTTSIRRTPISSSLVIALLLPLLMWAAAAGIAWLVVDRLLIRPLQRLRASVAAFTPGEVIDVGADGSLPAAEIRELGDTFRAISRTVAIHEAGLAEGLVRQTKLTREVHHRVKNNLQVISSLINFHARGAISVDAAAAYASIQRRVDALAVVHRNHFADVEDSRGLNIRTMLGELATNLRATAPAASQGLGISLEAEPLLVNQDVGVSIGFLVTELVELAMTCDPRAQIRVAVRAGDEPGRAVLRVVSRALIETDELRLLTLGSYARIMEGLARQLRAPLHHEPLAGVYEIGFGVIGRG